MHVTQKIPATVHDVYATLFHLDTTLHHKNTILTQLMTSERSWRVIGITPKALAILVKKPKKTGMPVDEFERKMNKVQRAHIVSRFSIAHQVFAGDLMQPGEFARFFHAFDRTVLVAHREHAHDPDKLPNVIPLTLNDNNILFSGKGIGYRCGKEELAHLGQLNPGTLRRPLDLLEKSVPTEWLENLKAMVAHTKERRRGRKA